MRMVTIAPRAMPSPTVKTHLMESRMACCKWLGYSFFLVVLISTLSARGGNLYWFGEDAVPFQVGGAGFWDDAIEWSSTYPVRSAGTVPTSGDDVFLYGSSY